MQKFTIDLLPAEFKQAQVSRAKFYKIQSIGIVVIAAVAFVASLVIALRILQNQKTLQLQNRVQAAAQSVSTLKTTQGYLLLLKNRLAIINQYLGTSSKQAKMYNLVEKLLPGAVTLSTISVSRDGGVSILLTSTDGDSLDLFLNRLLSKNTNEDKVREISMDSFSRGRDGIYRLTLNIKPK